MIYVIHARESLATRRSLRQHFSAICAVGVGSRGAMLLVRYILYMQRAIALAERQIKREFRGFFNRALVVLRQVIGGFSKRYPSGVTD